MKERLDPYDMVLEFMTTYGQTVRESPTLDVDWSEKDLRDALIEEEFKEYRTAVATDNLVEVADALADMIYVIYGAAHTYGIPLDEVMAEVHRSNMSKVGEDGEPIFREDGKVLKGPNYSPPDIASILACSTEGCLAPRADYHGRCWDHYVTQVAL